MITMENKKEEQKRALIDVITLNTQPRTSAKRLNQFKSLLRKKFNMSKWDIEDVISRTQFQRMMLKMNTVKTE